MIRHFIGSALIAYAAVLTPSFSDAGQSAQLMAGDPSGPNVAFPSAARASKDFA